MPFLFSLTLFCNAFLLFQVQPIVGKLLLPKLGGTPAVWNTCMVFFQATLLAGYAYAHATSKWLGSRSSSLLHLVVLLLPLIVLPVTISDDAFRSDAATDSPILLVLGQLVLAVGLPFFVISTTAPLLQRWFSDTGHPSAHDPYFLYAASNLGSMLSLIAYPVLVEPQWALDRQSWFWMRGYVVCALLVGLCALTLRTKPPQLPEATPKPLAVPEVLTWPRRLRWIFLAFVPSSLLLGCTTGISTDLAPIPLLWIVPLSLYLLSFIIVFAKKPWVPHELACRILPISVLVLTLLLVMAATEVRGLPFWVLLLVHLVALLLTALVAHGELAHDRPHAEHLTEFFLLMSVGGMLGGMFNALVAPVMFRTSGLTEYPLAIVLACLVRPKLNDASRPNAWDGIMPVLVGVLAIGMWLLAESLNLEPGPTRNVLTFGIPGLVVFTFADRVVRFGFGVAVIFVASAINTDQKHLTLERNFFGVVRVVESKSSDGYHFRQMLHGNTLHGQMRLDATDADGRHEPLTYYHRTGPIGVVCEQWAGSKAERVTVGAVGLGTGSLAYYARPGDTWSFYEIDPAIERIAANPVYFSFLSECRAVRSKTILGDAYLRLQEAPEGSFDLLVLDAFSSDSIPVHLMTREAVALYRSRLKPNGLLAFHISNRYLNLRPILAKLAEDAGWVARAWRDPPTEEQKKQGKTESEWVIMAAQEAGFGPLLGEKSRWGKIESKPDTPLWTNNFSNLLSALGR